MPNLYPALPSQEVVVNAPRHVRSIRELTGAELDLVAEAWSQRARALGGYVHALINEGREAGASLPHTHSQLAAIAEPPPAVAVELAVMERECPLCSRPPEGLVVAEENGLVASAAWAGRQPYELIIAPAGHEPDPWSDPRLATALRLAAALLRGVAALEGPPPVNLWLHAAGHWHLEVVPRLTVPAGLELGAGIYVNTLAPEEAAARLRATPGASARSGP